MTLERRIEKLEQEMSSAEPSGERETIHFKIGKGYYEPTPEELEEMREYDLAHSDKGDGCVRYRIMPFKRNEAAQMMADSTGKV